MTVDELMKRAFPTDRPIARAHIAGALARLRLRIDKVQPAVPYWISEADMDTYIAGEKEGETLASQAHLSEPPQGAQLAGWHPTEDCFAALMPDGSARLYISGHAIEDDAPLHTVSDLARMDLEEYRTAVERILSGQVSLKGKNDDGSN